MLKNIVGEFNWILIVEHMLFQSFEQVSILGRWWAWSFERKTLSNINLVVKLD